MAKKSPSRTCTNCGGVFPATRKYWHVDGSKDDGWHSHCKGCRTRQEGNDMIAANQKAAEQLTREIEKTVQEEIDRRLSARLERAQLMSLKFLEELDEAKVEGSAVPHISEQYQKLVEAFGGAGGIAQFYLLEFLSSKPGSQNRQRILDRIVKLGIDVSNDGSAAKPIELMDQDELREAIEAYGARVMKIETGKMQTNDVSEAS